MEWLHMMEQLEDFRVLLGLLVLLTMVALHQVKLNYPLVQHLIA
jgi:hypothetical protein